MAETRQEITIREGQRKNIKTSDHLRSTVLLGSLNG